MNAQGPPQEFVALGIVAVVFGSIALVMTTTILTATLTSYWRKTQARQLGSQLIHEMLQRKMQPDEIERILALWTEDRRLAKKILREPRPEREFANAEYH